jgi:hypothetical protein
MKTTPLFLSRALLATVSIGAMASCSSSISGDRPVAADGRAIHGPQQLNEFVLAKPVEIRGLGTKAALEKLDREYRESCRKAGEVPLDLAYEVPAGYERPLNLTTGMTFERAVEEIAATSKLDLKRRGATYHLQAPKENDRLVRETYSVPPDFLARVSEDAYEQRLPIRAAFEKRGVSFDGATRLRLSGANLAVETRDRGDQAAISGTVNAVAQGSPRQVRLDYRTFTIPAGQSWNAPANGMASDKDLAGLRQIPGVQEYVPREGTIETRRLHEPGQNDLPGGKLRYEVGLLGFGTQVKAELEQKTRGRRRVVLPLEGPTPDGATRIATTGGPDGSRVVLAVTPTILDATGRPVHGAKP